MSYNGSGVFTINTAGQPVITGTTISSTTFNSLTADLATGLTTALTKDGQSTPTANIGMGAFKITNLAAGTVASDAARLDQVQGGAATFISVTGTDSLTGTVVPALSAYATGNQFSFLVANTNTGAVTINVDGIGTKAITRTGTTALVAGDMVAGQAVEIIYDGTRFQLVNGNSFTNLKVSGTLGVTGVATFTAQPIVSSLTAALPVFTDASKGLVSNTITGTGDVVMSTSPTLVTPALGTPSALVGTNITGTATNFTASNVTTNANLTGEATSVGNATTLTNSAVIGKVITGYVSGAGTVAATDTILQAIQKLNGNDATNANLTGPITSVGNATSIASQTGTGTTFAMSASPTFTGTVGAAALTTTGNTILGDASTDTLNVGNGGLVKDAIGNVGIGTASPVQKFVVSNGGAAGLEISPTAIASSPTLVSYNRSGTVYTQLSYDALLHVWDTSGTERMRIDASGNLLLGSTSATGTGALRGSYGTGGITSNFAAGDGALNANTSGTYNSAVGKSSLSANTTGSNNTASGAQALQNNLSGGSNTASGVSALQSNTSGGSNTANGVNALQSNLTNSNNTAIGYYSLYYNTADNNTAVGFQAMVGASGTSTGTNNAALGYKALYSNTSGSENVAIGASSLELVTSNSGNTACGTYSLGRCTGSNNTSMGNTALYAVTTGSNNAAFGYNTAQLLTTGSSNQVFGDSIILAAAATGRIAIGSSFTQGVNTSVIIGNGTNRISNSYTVNATWAFSSDERIKNVIGKDTLGLDFINDLEPVTFRWKPSNEVPKELTSRYAEENVQDTDLVMHGLIAQNVKAALDKAGVDTFTGWSEDEDGTQKLGITDLITPMINAIKELTARVKQLEGK